MRQAGGKQDPAAGRSGGTETIDHHSNVLYPFPRDSQRIGQGSEDYHSRAMLIVMHDRYVQSGF
jgi:hypothetical protein